MFDGSERRRHVRKQVDLPAVLRAEEIEERVLVTDMSLGGAFMQTELELSFGSAVRLEIDLGILEPVAVSAVVRWRKRDGMGVHFGSLGARDTYVITEYLASRPLLLA